MQIVFATATAKSGGSINFFLNEDFSLKNWLVTLDHSIQIVINNHNMVQGEYIFNGTNDHDK